MGRKNKIIPELKIKAVKEYLDGKSLNNLYQTYGVAKSTIAGWIKKYSEECQYIKPHNKEKNASSEEIRALNKKIKELEKENIESRPLWKPMHLQPVFSSYPALVTGISEALFEKGLCLPSGSNLSSEDKDRILSCLLRNLHR